MKRTTIKDTKDRTCNKKRDGRNKGSPPALGRDRIKPCKGKIKGNERSKKARWSSSSRSMENLRVYQSPFAKRARMDDGGAKLHVKRLKESGTKGEREIRMMRKRAAEKAWVVR